MFERGQAALETALVMPLMIFFTLGIIQLAMVQQARLTTEYAAYQASRAGIVWNGSNERMHDAAVFALLPTMPASKDIADWDRVADAYRKQLALDGVMRPLPWGISPPKVNGQSLTGQIRVDTLNPTSQSGKGIWNQASSWDELEFDGPETYPESPQLEANLQHFFNVNVAAADQNQFRSDTILEIRLRYLYEMRIPFANQVIFLAWYAANGDVALYGAIDRSTTSKQNMLGRSGSSSSLKPRGRGIKNWNPSDKGFDPITADEMQVLWDISTGATRLLGAEHRYFLPLYATHSMRMQSNFYKKWLVH